MFYFAIILIESTMEKWDPRGVVVHKSRYAALRQTSERSVPHEQFCVSLNSLRGYETGWANLSARRVCGHHATAEG